MTTNDFKLGMANVVETLEHSSLLNDGDQEQAIQACREAVKLRELANNLVFALGMRMLTDREQRALDQLRKALNK